MIKVNIKPLCVEEQISSTFLSIYVAASVALFLTGVSKMVLLAELTTEGESVKKQPSVKRAQK